MTAQDAGLHCCLILLETERWVSLSNTKGQAQHSIKNTGVLSGWSAQRASLRGASAALSESTWDLEACSTLNSELPYPMGRSVSLPNGSQIQGQTAGPAEKEEIKLHLQVEGRRLKKNYCV